MIQAFERKRKRIFSLRKMRRKAQVTVEVKPEPKVKVSPEMLTDNRRFKELGENIAGNDPLDFPGYEDRGGLRRIRQE